jgi:glycogen(starch) synthase
MPRYPVPQSGDHARCGSWDIDEMANKMVAVLRQPPLQETLRTNGHSEARKFRWEEAAARVNEIYQNVLDAV